MYPCFGFLVMSPPGFKTFLRRQMQCRIPKIQIPLVLHILTSWQLVVQLVTSPHASAEVGLDSGSNPQSPEQKKKTLPLCPANSTYFLFQKQQLLCMLRNNFL